MKSNPPPSKLIIAIDGPSGSGKGTVAHLLARHYQLLHLDSGSCYRAVTWLALRHRVNLIPENAPEIIALLEKFPIQLQPNSDQIGPKFFIYVGSEDITDHIRTPDVSRAVSIVATMPEIRHQMVLLQQKIAADSPNGVVMEGRDITTVVLPQANFKFFLTASAEVRAQRRHADFVEKGVDISYQQVYSDLVERDQRDTERQHSPLKVATDASIIDSTNLTVEQTVAVICQHIDQAQLK